MTINRGFKTTELKYDVPNYPLKRDFTPGTFSENEWKCGESACTDRHFYRLPNGSEYAVFKFSERTRTGNKRVRYEVWHNGKFSNNYFNNDFDEAIRSMENEIVFFGYELNRAKYAI